MPPRTLLVQLSQHGQAARSSRVGCRDAGTANQAVDTTPTRTPARTRACTTQARAVLATPEEKLAHSRPRQAGSNAGVAAAAHIEPPRTAAAASCTAPPDAVSPPHPWPLFPPHGAAARPHCQRPLVTPWQLPTQLTTQPLSRRVTVPQRARGSLPTLREHDLKCIKCISETRSTQRSDQVRSDQTRDRRHFR